MKCCRTLKEEQRNDLQADVKRNNVNTVSALGSFAKTWRYFEVRMLVMVGPEMSWLSQDTRPRYPSTSHRDTASWEEVGST